MFDILTEAEMVQTKAEVADVKNAFEDLLATLKREKLVRDWRESSRSRRPSCRRSGSP